MEILLFFNGILNYVWNDIIQIIPLALEPVPVLVLGGLSQVINAFLGMPFKMYEIYIVPPAIYFIVLGIYLLGKPLLCLRFTRSVAMIIYGTFEKTIGIIFSLYFLFCGINKAISYCEKNLIFFRNKFGNFAETAVVITIVGVSILTFLLVFTILFLTMRAMYALQISQLSISYIPFTSFYFEFFRTLLAVVFFFGIIMFPRIFMAIGIIFLIVSFLLSESVMKYINYFNDIYRTYLISNFKTNWRKQRIPKEVLSVYEEEKDEVWISVHPMILEKNNHLPFVKYEKWYLCIQNENVTFYRKKFWQKKVDSVVFEKSDYQFYYILDDIYLEIFTLDGPKENIIRLFKKPKKDFSFVISYRYEKTFEEIIRGLNATDYKQLKKDLTAQLKEKRILEEN